MKKFLILVIVFLSTWSSNSTFAQGSWPINDMWLTPPVAGEEAKKESKLKLMLWRADKPRRNYWHRYYPHITHREYVDCSYFKYVDCSNFTYCRCWQCRDYVYPVTEHSNCY